MPRRPAASSSASLRQLVALSRRYDGEASGAKRCLLDALSFARLPRAREVLQLHEVLCFLRAYPDDPALLDRVEGLLETFPRRADLRRHRAALADSGIAGTAIHYRFFWPVARWLARRWPERLFLVWDDADRAQRIRRMLPLLVTPAEAEALASTGDAVRRVLDRLRGPRTTDATFLVRRIEALPGDDRLREALHDGIDAPYRLEPSPGSPSRTRARHPRSPAAFRARPPSRVRPDLRSELQHPPRAVRSVAPREARELIELALEAMVTRSRDLEAFGHGDPRDVRIVEDGDGLQFVCIGVIPERRRLLHATYAYLTLQSGVPVGYVQVDPLFRAAGISYNTFETFRGGEAARIFGRVLAATRHLFGAEAFSIEPYQLGLGNDEGLASGAFWFYYKLGFRPRDAGVRRVLRGELARIERDPAHRSSRATLRRLAAAPLHFESDRARQPPPAPPWDLGWVVARELRRRRGADREDALRDCSEQARRLLGAGPLRAWTAAEREAWRRLCPLILALPGVAGWPAAHRRILVEVIRTKGGRRESDFVRRFDAHPTLARAVLRLARDEDPASRT